MQELSNDLAKLGIKVRALFDGPIEESSSRGSLRFEQWLYHLLNLS